MQMRIGRAAGQRGDAAPAATAAPAFARRPLGGNQAMLRRLAVGGSGGAGPRTAPASVHAAVQGGGRPLDAAMRSYFEPRLGADLGAVRLHTDAPAARSAAAVDAAAYALGPHVVFAAGRHAPERPDGFRLLAHELAHVAQSGGAIPAGPVTVGETGAPQEHEADDAAARLTAGLPARVGAAGGTVLRRDGPDVPDKKMPPTPPPWLPMPGGFAFNPAVSVPFLGGGPLTPFDLPQTVPAQPGKAALEDLHAVTNYVFGSKPASYPVNRNTTMPGCTDLQSAGGGGGSPSYLSYASYLSTQKGFHGPQSAAPWPVLSAADYQALVATCQQAPKLRAPPPGSLAPLATPPAAPAKAP